MPIRNHIVYVIDSSGSMQSLRDAVVSGFNEQVQTAKASPNREHTTVGLLTFANTVQEKFFEQPVEVLREISTEDYRPCGGTALYDALGYAIQRLQASVYPDSAQDTYLVIVLTDGQENSSGWTTQIRLRNEVLRLQATGRWTFVFMGANLDLTLLQASTGVATRNLMHFVPDSAGTVRGLGQVADSVKSYMSESSRGVTPDNADFYGSKSV